MIAKLLSVVAIVSFLGCYLVGVKTLRLRLLLLIGLIVGLGILIPNLRSDRAFFLEKNFVEFTQHIEKLLKNSDEETARKKVAAFNKGFPMVARNTEAEFDFIQLLIETEQPSVSNNQHQAKTPSGL